MEPCPKTPLDCLPVNQFNNKTVVFNTYFLEKKDLDGQGKKEFQLSSQLDTKIHTILFTFQAFNMGIRYNETGRAVSGRCRLVHGWLMRGSSENGCGVLVLWATRKLEQSLYLFASCVRVSEEFDRPNTYLFFWESFSPKTPFCDFSLLPLGRQNSREERPFREPVQWRRR